MSEAHIFEKQTWPSGFFQAYAEQKDTMPARKKEAPKPTGLGSAKPYIIGLTNRYAADIISANV